MTEEWESWASRVGMLLLQTRQHRVAIVGLTPLLLPKGGEGEKKSRDLVRCVSNATSNRTEQKSHFQFAIQYNPEHLTPQAQAALFRLLLHLESRLLHLI